MTKKAIKKNNTETPQAEVKKNEDPLVDNKGTTNAGQDIPVTSRHTEPTKNILIKTANISRSITIGTQTENPCLHPIFIYNKDK